MTIGQKIFGWCVIALAAWGFADVVLIIRDLLA